MGTKFVITLLLAGVVTLSHAQSPSPSSTPAPAPPPQNPAPVVAATPAPTPAPVVETELVVSIPDQKLAVVVNGKLYKTYKISTSRYGEGDALGSWCTPTGHLAVATKIGGTVPYGGVFQGRRFTGEVLSVNAPGRDPIVSRIIWLRGLEYGNKNAYHRCIYIHGTPQEDTLGKKASYGCIRMASNDVIEIYSWIAIGTEVAVVDKGLVRAVRDVADDRRLMATNNTTKPDSRGELVR
jgi:lipoprotein-anchoring transpeptidase ErfK/SrfK